MATKKITSSNYQIQTQGGLGNTDILSNGVNISGAVLSLGNGSQGIITQVFHNSRVNAADNIGNAAIRWNTDGSNVSTFQWTVDGNAWYNFVGTDSTGAIATLAPHQIQGNGVPQSINSIGFEQVVITDAIIEDLKARNYYTQTGGANVPLFKWNNTAVLYGNSTSNTFTSSNNFTFDGNTLSVPSIATTGNGNISVGNIVITGSITQTANVENYFEGNVVINANLRVAGNITTVGANTLTVDDKVIVIANAATQPSDAQGAGLVIDLGGGATPNANIYYNSVNDTLNLNKQWIVANGIVTPSNLVANTITANSTLTSLGQTYLANLLNIDGSNFVAGDTGYVQFANLTGNARLNASNAFTWNNTSNTLTISNVANVGTAIWAGITNSNSNVFVANSQGVHANAHNYSNGTSIIREAANANTTLQFNYNGFLRGSNAFVFDTSSNLVSLTGNITATGNVTSNNFTANSNISAGNIAVSSNIAVGNISATANILAAGNLQAANLIATANLRLGNGNSYQGNAFANVYYYGNTNTLLTGGSNTNIQYNLNGRFSGSNALSFDQSSNTLNVLGTISATTITFANGLPISGVTPPPGVNQNIIFNNQGVTDGAPTFNYDIATGNVTAGGNLIAQTKSLGLTTPLSVVAGTASSPSNVRALASNANTYVLLEVPTANITVANVSSKTGNGPYIVTFNFTSNNYIQSGSNVTIVGATPSGFNGTYTVVAANVNYANVSYPTDPTPSNTSISGASIQLPAYFYTSADAQTWTYRTFGPTQFTVNTPRVKYDTTSNIFYTVLASTTSAAVLTSADGATWITRNANTTLPTSTAVINDFVYNPAANTYLAVGTTGSLQQNVWKTDANGAWYSAPTTAPLGNGGPLVSVAVDTANRYAAIDTVGTRWYSINNGNTWNYGIAAPHASYSGYVPIVYLSTPNVFAYANSFGTSSTVETFNVANATTSTVQYTANTLITDINYSVGSSILIGQAVSTTQVIRSANLLSGSYSLVGTLTGTFNDSAYSTTINRLALSNTTANITYVNIITSGGGNVYAGNVIADNYTIVTGNISNLTATNETVTGTLNVSSVGNLQLNGGNVGQFIGVNTSNVLSFIDRVTFANLQLGSSLPTTADINNQLPANLANNQQNGSMVFNTDTDSFNTQPLYIYLNGAWRQMMVSGAL